MFESIPDFSEFLGITRLPCESDTWADLHSPDLDFPERFFEMKKLASFAVLVAISGFMLGCGAAQDAATTVGDGAQAVGGAVADGASAAVEGASDVAGGAVEAGKDGVKAVGEGIEKTGEAIKESVE